MAFCVYAAFLFNHEAVSFPGIYWEIHIQGWKHRDRPWRSKSSHLKAGGIQKPSINCGAQDVQLSWIVGNQVWKFF